MFHQFTIDPSPLLTFFPLSFPGASGYHLHLFLLLSVLFIIEINKLVHFECIVSLSDPEVLEFNHVRQAIQGAAKVGFPSLMVPIMVTT